MKNKKDSKEKVAAGSNESEAQATGPKELTSKAELKTFLNEIKKRVFEESTPAIYAVGAMNHVMTLPTIYDLLDNDNRELMREIWTRLKVSGIQLRNPPLLFEADGEAL